MQGDYADFAGADSLDGIDYVHPTRVAMLAIVIGRTLDIPRSELISLAMASALMNVGYLALRRSLLDEPRRLLDGEWEEHIHTHPLRGAAILERSGLQADCLRAIEEHHERWDGSGYPAGLRDDAIARHARILAVADTYVALRSVRPHRRPLDDEQALAEIAAGRGTLYDPAIVDALTEAIARFADNPQAPIAGPDERARARSSPDEHARAQRDRTGDIDAAAEPTRTQDEDPLQPSLPAGTRRTPPPRRPRVEDAARVGVPTIATLDAPRVAAATRSRRSEPAAASATAGRRRPGGSRRAEARRTHPHHGLFAPALYVDAALSGRWRLDRF
jgi:hypothetical protein